MGQQVRIRNHRGRSSIRMPGGNLVLCDNLEGWDGVAGGREVQECWDIHILMADSRGCVAEANTTL